MRSVSARRWKDFGGPLGTNLSGFTSVARTELAELLCQVISETEALYSTLAIFLKPSNRRKRLSDKALIERA